MNINLFQSKTISNLFIRINIFLFCLTVFAQKEHINTKKNIAIQGYEPVSYFTEDKAIKGNSDIKSDVNGVIYLFSSKENKAIFDKNPNKYIPQYGGYCAYGVSNGYKAPITPEAFSIVDGKLYLNYNLDVRKTWLKTKEERISNGNKNWEKIISK